MGAASSSRSPSETHESTLASSHAAGNDDGLSVAIKPFSPSSRLSPFLLSRVTDTWRLVGEGTYTVVRELEVKGRKCAGKTLGDAVHASSTGEERDGIAFRFVNACKILHTLKHPNVVRFLGVHVDPGSWGGYLVTELMDSSLAGYLEQHETPPTAIYYNILSDVALGLHYLHHLSPPIVHRNLTANNVLLSSTLQAKLSDVCLAEILGFSPAQKVQAALDKGPRITCYLPSHSLKGEPLYMTALDCFSLGILILHTLCGNWPIPSANTAPSDSDFPDSQPVSEFDRRHSYIDAAGSTHPLMGLVQRCLDSDPEGRPPITVILQEITKVQLQFDAGKTYYPRSTHTPAVPWELAVAVGDNVRVLGAEHKRLKVFSMTTKECGYVPCDLLRQLHQLPLAIATRDFHSDADNSLTLSRSDIVHIFSMVSDDWWFVRSRRSGKQGFIPSSYMSEHLESYRWYVADTSHSNADQLLKSPQNDYGSFLVHDTQHVRCLALRAKDSIMHYQVQTTDTCLYIVKEVTFRTLQDLVYHYSHHVGVLCMKLRQPFYLVRGDEEIDRSTVKLVHRTGVEAFGEVWKGLKSGTQVLVKTVNAGSEVAGEMIEEAMLLTQLRHPHIIQCMGLCTRQEPAYILMELMKHGNLQDYLSKGEGKALHSLELFCIALQVARGMAYLERLNYIHSSLAAAGIFVGNGQMCKIGNFSKAHRGPVYTLPPGAQVPIRWTAPEVFTTNEYTTKCDVWSFGVVLHEITTRGERPYNQMSNEETLRSILSGYRMPQPVECPRELYDVMLKCWSSSAESRLSFKDIERQLEESYISQCAEDKTHRQRAHSKS